MILRLVCPRRLAQLGKQVAAIIWALLVFLMDFILCLRVALVPVRRVQFFLRKSHIIVKGPIDMRAMTLVLLFREK